MDLLRRLLLIAACGLLVAVARGQYRVVVLKTPSGGGWGVAIDGANAYGTSRYLPFYPTEHLLWSLETGDYRVDVVGSIRSMRGKWGSGGTYYGFGPTALATKLDTLQIAILDTSPIHYSGANDTDGVRHVGSRHQQFSYQDH